MASTSSTELGNAFEGVSPPYASASSSEQPWDVFINHCGRDVKHTLAANICNTLRRTGLRVFLDVDALKGGDTIPTKIEEAMRSASVHIAIFSINYAQSPWCLAELSCMLKTGTTIIPVFYHVDPSDLRRVAEGKGKYASVFSEYEDTPKKDRYTKEKLQEWKVALTNVSLHSGYVIKDNCQEGEALKKIRNMVFEATNKVPLVVAKHPVGLDCMVQELETCILQSTQSGRNVQIVGIEGEEGVGKTTLAKEIYNQKFSSFENSSFIFDVAARKNAIHKKQKQLLNDIGVFQNPDLDFHHKERGKAHLASRLKNLSLLIVLDDVDHEDQLDDLLPVRDHLGSGSLIIVTSRKLGVLTYWGIPSNNIYKMRRLDQSQAEQVFCWHAFLQPHPKEGFEDLVRKHLIECDGLPLHLMKCGEQVYKKSMDCPRSKAAESANSDANASDIEWERKLPPNYHKILSRAVAQKSCSSMEEICVALCNSIQIDKGEQIVWLDQWTGKIALKASARSLAITWGEDDKYWRWVSTEESRFGQVIELVEVWFFHVHHRLDCTLLSPNTEYIVAFVVKIDKSRMHSYQSPFEFSLQTIEGDLIESARFLDDLEKPVESHRVFNTTPLKYAENGWMEFVVGEFFLKEDEGSRRPRVIDVYIKNENSNFKKTGIILDGIKITPKYLQVQ